jgi:hypothetical protein
MASFFYVANKTKKIKVMKIHKSFELLNSEGPILQIVKIEGHWHYKFANSPHYNFTTIKEILSAICYDTPITNTHENKDYFLSQFPLSMKGGNSKHYDNIVKYLTTKEIKRS